MAEMENSKDLISVLWSGADILRSKMDANEYKNYLLGMSFSDIWGDNGAKWLNIYTKTALEGLTQNIEDYNENLKKYLSVDCYQPMYGYCGCFMRDVTQRRDMERQLYEEKERYRVAMESSTDRSAV